MTISSISPAVQITEFSQQKPVNRVEKPTTIHAHLATTSTAPANHRDLIPEDIGLGPYGLAIKSRLAQAEQTDKV